MTGVPWFLVKTEDGLRLMYNGALLEGVELFEDGT